MTSLTSFRSVPVIDIAGLFAGDDTSANASANAYADASFDAVAREIGTAARDVGFFYVTGTGLDQGLVDALLEVTVDFFAKPLEEKMRSYIGLSDCHRGYVPQGEEVFAGGTADLKEAFDSALDLPADDPEHLAGVPLLGPNQWPDQPGFAATVTAYYEAALAVGHALFRAFAHALGQPADFFLDQASKAPSQLRLIHYPYDPSAQDAVGIGAHTDYECFTLLKPTAPGLEVLNGAGEWIDVPPLPDAFVVNVGDLLEVWSNGSYVATTHRVRRVAQERYSFPLFCCVSYDTVIEPLAGLDGIGGRGRHDGARVVAGEHLFAQTAQSFSYLKRLLATGELTLPADARRLSSFGQEALQRTAGA